MSKVDVDVPVKGGFSFDLCRRNEMLMKKGLKPSSFLKTGTTIVGLIFEDGVILGADTRATEGPIVADKNCEKIHYMVPNIYCCGAGTAADTEAVTAGEELTMNRKYEVPKKDSKTQVVKLDKAFKLAEQWVKNMSKPSEDQSSKVLLKARPPRLGLGAAVPRQAYVAPSSDPIERKLRGNLDAAKRKAAKDALESVPSARDESVEEDSEEELESRSKAISKRPAKNFNSSLQARKRQK